jgi:hypothetical protein
MAGGGGSSSGGGKNLNVAPAGPARSLATFPQYNPVMYAGMQPGAMPGATSAGGMPTAPMQSYMPAVNGLPAGQLIQSLMAGYAGVPMATQPTGATAPGMGTMSQPEGSLPTVPAGDLWAGLPKKTRRRLKKIGVNSGTYDPETDYDV